MDGRLGGWAVGRLGYLDGCDSALGFPVIQPSNRYSGTYFIALRILAHVSRKASVRLNTSVPSDESESTQK